MKIEIDWGKVVTQTVTTLVVGVFMGACIIVWRGATSVDEKVKTTEGRLEFVIKQLSEKLATYEVRMSEVTNQLAKILEQTKLTEAMVLTQRKALPTYSVPFSVEQKALSKDIYEQLKK